MAKAADNVVVGSESEWETVVEPYGESWDFSKNPVIIGTYVSSKSVELTDNRGDKRENMVYEIESGDDGGKYSVWGGYALDEAFAQIETGTVVRIEFQGKAELSNGQTVNKFVVQTKK